MNIVLLSMQAMDLLSGLIPCSEESTVTLSAAHLGRLFLFSLMWSVGALLELEDRAKMEQFLIEKVCKYLACVNYIINANNSFLIVKSIVLSTLTQ